ncbi:UNVERIFIED_CONTAM: Protein of unknown function (DUF2953) [Acetivibrio alkalicellulosi]
MTVLIILGYVLLALLLFLILLLVIPTKYSFKGQKYERSFIRAKVSVLFGMLGFSYYNDFEKKNLIRILILGLPINIPKGKEKDKKKKDKNIKDKDNSRDYLNVAFIKSALKSVKRIILHIKPKRFEIEGRIGFEDPFYTGVMCAFQNILVSQLKDAKINVTAEFEDEIYEGKGLIQGRVVLLYVAYIALKLYRSRPVKIKAKKTKFKEVKNYG